MDECGSARVHEAQAAQVEGVQQAPLPSGCVKCGHGTEWYKIAAPAMPCVDLCGRVGLGLWCMAAACARHVECECVAEWGWACDAWPHR